MPILCGQDMELPSATKSLLEVLLMVLFVCDVQQNAMHGGDGCGSVCLLSQK